MEFSAVITIRPIIFFKIQLKKVSGLRKLQIYPMNMGLLLELIFIYEYISGFGIYGLW